MTVYLAIAAYRCFVSGIATGSVDIKVRWFKVEDEQEVRRGLIAEPAHCYVNDKKETVTWQLAQIFAVDEFVAPASGDEITGFIATARELAALA